MDSLIDIADGSRALDLSRIRYQLIRLEDTIIFNLIERVQFPLNQTIYTPGALSIPRTDLSLVEWYLFEQEKLQSLIRRFESPDEVPFYPEALQTPILKPLNYPKILYPNTVCVNDEIKSFYIKKFLPEVCPDFGRADRGESEENYGSTSTCDINCLQALSRRIHFGKFVAESKFQAAPDAFSRLIRSEDRVGIAKLITNELVEEQVLERLRLKALTYGKDPSKLNGRSQPVKINVDAVVSLYRENVIPLTKEVEVEYLMQRLIPEEQKNWFGE